MQHHPPIAAFLLLTALCWGVSANADSAKMPEIVVTRSPAYPSPFHNDETYSTNISLFYKWTSVLARMDARKKSLPPWKNNAEILKGLSSTNMAQRINGIINEYEYISDVVRWGKTDYWETPAEFFDYGGDCEDYAIAKYAWFSSLGVPENKMRIAIVYDRIRNAYHAVLILYLNNKAMILDNQVKDVRDSQTTSRYRMIYSINRQGWWLPQALHAENTIRKNGITFRADCLNGAPAAYCINAVEPAAQ